MKTYYVDGKKGNDANRGGSSKPFKTIAAAVEKVKPGDTVYVGDGVYYESVHLPSGDKGKPVTIAAKPGTKPVITPSVRYTGKWKIYKNKIYVADLSEYVYDMDTENVQLFLNKDSMVEARYPNMGPSMKWIMDYKRAVAQQGTDKNTIAAKEKLPLGLKGATAVIWPGEEGLSAWVAFTSPVYSAYGSKIRLSNSIDQEETLIGANAYSPVAGNPFYITGALSLLDAPGEYFFDRKSSKMYLYTPNGENPEKYVTTLRSNSSTAINAESCSYITIKGFSIYGGGINMKGSSYCRLENCSVRYADHFYASGYASFSIACSTRILGDYNTVTGCEFGPTAGDGITIGGKNNVFTNNIVHDCNYSGNDFAGVFVRESEGLVISECLIFNSARAHIFFDIQKTFSKCVIRNNHFKNHATLNSDCGPFYTWSCDGGGTEIKFNFVECGDKNDNGTNTKYRDGMYIDNYSSNFKVHHNIVIGGESGLRTNLPNRNTIFANNTVIGSKHGYGIFSVPKDNAEAKETGFFNNLFVNLIGSEILYYGTENGKSQSYSGDLQQGKVPVTINEEQRMQSSNNSNGQVDTGYAPVDGSTAIDGGLFIEGITDGYVGKAPDIGAVEKGGRLFAFGPSWKLNEN